MPLNDLTSAAARLVVEDGLEYGAAKRKAARDLLRRHARASELPSNEAVEDSVREYLSVFMADTQPAELRALRRLALRWMERLADFRPHLAGAVWRGTATRRSVIQIELYCDDPKAAEIELLNQHADFASPVTVPNGTTCWRFWSPARSWANRFNCSCMCSTATTCVVDSSPTPRAEPGGATPARWQRC